MRLTFYLFNLKTTKYLFGFNLCHSLPHWVAMEHGHMITMVATTMYSWRFRFKDYQGIKEQKEGIPRNQWLPGYVQLYIENVRKSPSVYAQLRGQPPVSAVPDTIVPQAIIKTAVLAGTTNKK